VTFLLFQGLLDDKFVTDYQGRLQPVVMLA
jgi:hypothetical protein